MLFSEFLDKLNNKDATIDSWHFCYTYPIFVKTICELYYTQIMFNDNDEINKKSDNVLYMDIGTLNNTESKLDIVAGLKNQKIKYIPNKFKVFLIFNGKLPLYIEFFNSKCEGNIVSLPPDVELFYYHKNQFNNYLFSLPKWNIIKSNKFIFLNCFNENGFYYSTDKEHLNLLVAVNPEDQNETLNMATLIQTTKSEQGNTIIVNPKMIYIQKKFKRKDNKRKINDSKVKEYNDIIDSINNKGNNNEDQDTKEEPMKKRAKNNNKKKPMENIFVNEETRENEENNYYNYNNEENYNPENNEEEEDIIHQLLKIN